MALGAARSALLVDMLGRLDDEALKADSELPDWSRLSIICHLRYGASALRRMTHDTLAGRSTSYYPDGRAKQRPVTLRPRPGESSTEVVAGLAAASTALDTSWLQLDRADWARHVSEPRDNPDLGPVSLARLAISRLLEIDVHGTDLGIGFPDWSDLLVEVALPTRLAWLSTRRSNHRQFDVTLRGAWLLTTPDGLRWFVTVDGQRVESRPAETRDQPTATIIGDARDLLALLLGRPTRKELVLDGDRAFAGAFSSAFPGP